jgi:serine/threonine protein kinase
MLPVLKFIHEHDVIHRDLKPANILRDKEGQLVLIDFGAAKQKSKQDMAAGTVFGSQGYLAPEQRSELAVAASDLFSLGATCINLITGKSPAQMRDSPKDFFHWRDHLPEGSGDIDDYLGDLINRMTSPQVEQRYQSADEALKDLELCQLPPQPKADEGYLFAMPSKHDFSSLEQFLVEGNLKAADMETWNLICTSLNKPRNSKLTDMDVRKIPCNDFLNLDRLWLKYSAGRFGFTVKCDIYEAEGCDYKSFCDRIGYRLKRGGRYQWLEGSLVNYTIEAPKGHLPWVSGLYGSSGVLGQEDIIIAIKSTLAGCQAKLSRFGVVKLSN